MKDNQSDVVARGYCVECVHSGIWHWPLGTGTGKTTGSNDNKCLFPWPWVFGGDGDGEWGLGIGLLFREVSAIKMLGSGSDLIVIAI